MKKIKLESGLNLNLRDDVMDDMELLDDLVALDAGEGGSLSRVLGRILDKDEKKKLYDHLREDGVTRISKVKNALMEIFEKLGDPGKN